MKPLTQLPNATASELLPPCAATLAALAEAPPEAFSLRVSWCPWSDPGALLAALHSPAPPAPHALVQLLAAQSARCADWTESRHAAYAFSQTVAQVAARLAELAAETAEEVRAAAVLAPLGSLVRTQQGQPFRGAAEDYLLTRRLVRRWNLPPWLSHALLHLDFPVDRNDAEVPENRRLLLVQAALAVVQEEQQVALVPVVAASTDLFALLGLEGGTLRQLLPLLKEAHAVPAALPAEAAGLLLKALRATTKPQAMGGLPAVEELETELEALRAQLTRRRQQEQKQLQEQKLEALAEFAAGASHEINNPLAVISAQAQHLLKTEESLERAKGLERIITQARRIHTLLRDLLLYARPPEIVPRPVSVRTLVQAAMDKVTAAAATREVRVEAPTVPARLKVSGDPDLLETALVCLLHNAVAAAPAQGWVRLTVHADRSGHTTFLVEDNGPGLAPEARPHLFDPFYSAQGAGRGAGLGLSKVWRIAQLHGGTVELISDPPQPTQFRFRLPAPAVVETPRIAARNTPRK